jgi:hypothetical protein
MALTPTPRLGLYRPEGVDAFERTKFNETWDKLDAAPGVHICTSSSRPAWGTDQTGRLIFETDTNRIMRFTGSAWNQVKQAANGWYKYNNWANENVPRTVEVDKSVGSITSGVAGTCFFICTSSVQYDRGSVQEMYAGFKVGGTAQHGGERALVRWAIPTGSIPGSPDNDVRTITVMGDFPMIAGTKALVANFEAGNGANSVTIRHTRTMVWMIDPLTVS